MLDLHAKIRLTVAAILLFAVAWFVPELLVERPVVRHERAAGLLPLPQPRVAPEEEDESCPPGTATMEQCAALHRKAPAGAGAHSAQESAQAAAPGAAQNVMPSALPNTQLSASSSSARRAGPFLASASATPMPSGPPASPPQHPPSNPPGKPAGNPDGAAVPKSVTASPVQSSPAQLDGVRVKPVLSAAASSVEPTAEAEALHTSSAPDGAAAQSAKTLRTAAVARRAEAAEPAVGEGAKLPAAAAAARAPGAKLAVAVPAPRSWSVQVGSYATKLSAERMVSELVSQGVPAYVAPSRISRHKIVFRVRAPAADRDSALELALHLREAGYDVSLARPQTGASR